MLFRSVADITACWQNGVGTLDERFVFDDGSRVIFRLSGTSTEGSTLRVYLERCERNPQRHSMSPDLLLAELLAWADAVAGIRIRTGRKKADVIS